MKNIKADQYVRFIGGSKGGSQGRAPPPGGPNSFIFMQFSAKMWKIIAILGVGAPPGENPGSATEIIDSKTFKGDTVFTKRRYI